MSNIDTWSSIQMRSFIVKALWYEGELQDLDLADLLYAVKHTHRSKDWLRRFAMVWKVEVAATYKM